MRIIRTISDLGRLLSLGELSQIDTARTHTLTEDAYFSNIDKKTASLFVACARMGCYAAGAPDDATGTLARSSSRFATTSSTTTSPTKWANPQATTSAKAR